jgi:hypothetical protein
LDYNCNDKYCSCIRKERRVDKWIERERPVSLVSHLSDSREVKVVKVAKVVQANPKVKVVKVEKAVGVLRANEDHEVFQVNMRLSILGVGLV